MSFYSYRNSDSNVCPGKIGSDGCSGLTERVCIQVKKIYDSCMQQEQLDNLTVHLTDICPANTKFEAPITFESCRSTCTRGRIRDLCIERIGDRPNFARVRCKVDIPVEILFHDNTCREGNGRGVITVAKDVVLFVPEDSVIPYEVDNIVNAVSVLGSYVGENTFNLTACVTVILKIVADVELLIPAYGFCRIPPCEEFASEVCDEFFNLPIFPPEMGDMCCN